jgi:hypothetical protein
MSKMYKFDIPDFVSVPIAYSLSVKGLTANAFSLKSIFTYTGNSSIITL